MGLRRVFGLLLSIAYIYSANAQSTSCPLITVNDLGNTTALSTEGLIARAIVPFGEASGTRVPVRIFNFMIVCDASGDRRDTSSYVSVVVELRCNSEISRLPECDGNTDVTRQYQFQCNGQAVWDTIVSGSSLFVQTDPGLGPGRRLATLSTPLADQCRRCIDDQQEPGRTEINDVTHCDPCQSCNQGQGRCYVGSSGGDDNVCCNFYLQGNCAPNCSSGLEADSDFNCVCPELTLVGGAVSYSHESSSVLRDVGSVATFTCDSGYRLVIEGTNTTAQPNTQMCSSSGWIGQSFACQRIICPVLSILNGNVGSSPPDRVFMSRTIYTCDEDYALKGDGNRVCQIDSTWNGTDPECADCSAALADPNCQECGFDSSGLPVCVMCKSPYKPGLDGKCEKEGETGASSSSCDTGCIIGIVLAILGAIILSVVVALVVYAVYRYLSNPATKLAKAGTEGLNGVARDNPLYLPPEEIVGDVGDVETA